MIKKLILVCLVMLTISCTKKISIVDASNVRKSPTKNWSNRTLWSDPSIIKYKPQSLFGYFIEKNSADKDYRRTIQILPDDYEGELEALPQGEIYHSLIDSKFLENSNNSYPIFSFANSLSNNQIMEVIIKDETIMHLSDYIIPWSKLEDYVEKNPIKKGTERFYVQAVMVTQVYTKISTETNTDIAIGGAVSVDGKYYNQSENFQTEAYITMLLLDVDKIVENKSYQLKSNSFIEKNRVVKEIKSKLK